MDRRSLFFTSCVALVTTAISFSMRGDVLDALGADFHLNHEQLGLILSPAFITPTPVSSACTPVC
jgi:hypothetical protein